MGGYLEKRACTLLKAYFRERPLVLWQKKTFFSPSLSLRLFEQLRCGQSCKGSKNHPQRHYPQVFWAMHTSGHFCLSFEKRFRVSGFFLWFCIFVSFCLRWQARQNVPKSVAPTLSATDGVIFIQRTGSAPPFLPFALLFHFLPFSFHLNILSFLEWCFIFCAGAT